MKNVVISLACLCAMPAGASQLIGMNVPPYPEGTTSEMGSCIAVGDDICAYSLASLNGSDGAVIAVLAKRSIRHVEGQPLWEIFDSIPAPRDSESQAWAFEECHLDGSIDPSTIGLVAYQDKGGWIEVEETLWAVRLDIASGSLVELPPDRVRCVLPGS